MYIVFDFGGVLFAWQPPASIARLLPHRAPTVRAAQARGGEFFQGCGGDRSECDRGTLAPGRLVQHIAHLSNMPAP